MDAINRTIIEGLAFALPLFAMAIGGIYSERSGITNLAIEGLQGFGAFIGALVAVLITPSLSNHPQMIMMIAMASAMIGGAVYAMLHAVLCINFKANQVISGVVLNILAAALTGFLTSQINASVFGARSDKFQLGVSARFTVPYISKIPVLGAFFTDVYPFEIIILVVAFIAWYVLYRTRYGMHLRACGENPQAVDAAGINVARVRFSAVMVSGALSGLGGMCFAYSILSNFSSSIYIGLGYLAIAALIFGNWQVLPTLGACLIFGFARAGGDQFVLAQQLPAGYSSLMRIIPYVITLLLLVFFSKKNKAPAALGEVYDKGKR